MSIMHNLGVLGLISSVFVAGGAGCSGVDPGTSTGGLEPIGVGATPSGATGGVGAPPLGAGATPGVGSAGAGSGSAASGGGTNVGPSLCSTQVIDAYGRTPDMMIVLDRSLSMTIYGRWEPSKSAVQTITTEFERLMSFGLVMFPGGAASTGNPLDALGGLISGITGTAGDAGAAGGGGCSGGEKVDVPLKVLNAMAINQAVGATQTMGMTPTGAGLTAALTALGDRKPGLDTMVKPGYVLLVTDGEPSCNPRTSPDTAQTDAAMAAVKALKDANIPTYVIGYQIDPMWQPVMNQMAMIGGTGMFHPAESSDQIVQIFREITKDVVKCSFELSMVPPNPKFVRVTIDKQTVALDAADGWVLDGKTVTLQGGSCTTLKDGKGHAVNAQIECNEVTLN